jgi:hypothetical protein
MVTAGSKKKIVERFDCETLCSQKGEWLDHPRSKRGCTRIDLPPVAWDVDANAIHRGGWMGRHPITAAQADAQAARGTRIKVAPKYPTEDPDDGCPAGWYRSLFVASLYPYLRRRDSNGNRVANLMLDRTDDDVIVQLAMLAEDEQERWEAYRLEQMTDG